MKFLFDQNLSPRLPRWLSDLYPGSAHVRDIGLRDATDTVIWSYAQEHGFVIVSKDSDFQQRSLLFGHPPQGSLGLGGGGHGAAR
jgi:predicted nuclease of predicted toxin-antitoxin system